jgi:hypothetical protein
MWTSGAICHFEGGAARNRGGGPSMRIQVLACAVVFVVACSNTAGGRHGGQAAGPMRLASRPVVVAVAPSSAARIQHPGCQPDSLSYAPGWEIQPRSMDSIDTAAASVMAEKLAAGDAARRDNLDNYHRQYVGVQIAGRSLVYINGISRELDTFFVNPGPESSKNPEERLQALFRSELLQPNDAGAGHWAIVFDPATGRFGELAIGCSFGGPVAPDAGESWLPPPR